MKKADDYFVEAAAVIILILVIAGSITVIKSFINSL